MDMLVSEINLVNSVLLFHISKLYINMTHTACAYDQKDNSQSTCHEIAEILLMLALKSNQSNPQSINFLHPLLLISVEII